MPTTGDNFRAWLAAQTGGVLGNKPKPQSEYPVADKIWELALAATSNIRPPTLESAQQMDTNMLNSFDIPGASLASGPIVKKIKDLPMDEASRMARAKEMGFDTEKTLYHGTQRDVKAFDPASRGSATKAEDAKLGYFFSTNPEASAILSNFSAAPEIQHIENQIRNIKLKNKDLLDSIAETTDPIKRRELGDLWYNIFQKEVAPLNFEKNKIAENLSKEGFAPFGQPVFSGTDPSKMKSGVGGNIIPAHTKMKNPMVLPENQISYKNADVAEIIKKAQEAGHDGLIIKNHMLGGDTHVVFEPNQIRSVNAKFDPAKKNSGNILDTIIGTAGAGALGYALTPEEAFAEEAKIEALKRFKK